MIRAAEKNGHFSEGNFGILLWTKEIKISCTDLF